MKTALFFLLASAVVWTDSERPIADQIKGLRSVSDTTRGAVTKGLALQIRKLPAGANKLTLAHSLANLSTEGDFGAATLQEVGATLAQSLHEQELTSKSGMPEEPYLTLAQLVRYEHVSVPLNDPLLKAALARLQAEEQSRQKADFTLTDQQGKSWTLSSLHGKVVLVNFWATWCPPCRKEMPDLDVLYKRFAKDGLIVLAISDEPTVPPQKVSYPILLDPGGKVHKLMAIEGIPKSFVYDRQGKIVAQAIDMRTKGQFLEMLSRAGLK